MENPIEFSKRSRRAIILFISILIIVVLIPRVYNLFQDSEQFSFHQTNFDKIQFKKKVYTKTFYKSYSKKSKYKTPLQKFDPNTYTATDWMNLGMSQKQGDLIVKFGKRGFYSDEDLKKVFVISDQFFAVIKDSLFYPERKNENTVAKSVNKDVKIVFVELNSANETDLMELKGIGQFFAKNIIKKRNELGGFVKKEQLLEVWKMDQEKLANIEKNISIDLNSIIQLPLNTISAQELKNHPYFTWNVANSIVKLRSQLGGFQSIEDIRRSVLIDDEFFTKIKPYLTL
jgi:competence protein ComEA